MSGDVSCGSWNRLYVFVSPSLWRTINAAPFVSLEQRHKTRLPKMFVAGQRFCDAFSLHHDEGDAIGQRPFLVGAVLVKLQPFIDECTTGRNDGELILFLKESEHLQKHGTVRWA